MSAPERVSDTGLEQARGAQRGPNGVVVRRVERHQRQPDPLPDEPQLGQRPLDRDRVRLDEQRAVQRGERGVDGGRETLVATMQQTLMVMQGMADTRQ